MWGFIIALISGALMSIQGVFNTKVTESSSMWVLLGGTIGAVITWTVIKSMDNLGPAQAVLIIVISQIVVAYLIEVFGIFGVEKVPFEWSKLVGVVLAVVGIFIFKK